MYPAKKINEKVFIKMYEAGDSNEQIGTLFGLSTAGVHYRAKKLGIKKPDRPLMHKAVDVEKIIHLYVNEKKSCDKIAREIGVSDTLVNTRLKQNGIKLRTLREYWV